MHIRNRAALLLLAVIVSASALHAQFDEKTKFQKETDRTIRTINANLLHVQLTGDPDRDFLLLLETQLKGAISLAQLEIKYGDNADVKAVARQVVADRRRQLKVLDAMLEDFGTTDTAGLRDKEITSTRTLAPGHFF